MCPSQIACQSANTDPPVPPKDRPLPDISATAIIGRCTWAEVEWSVVVEFGVAAVALCAALPASPVRKIAGSRTGLWWLLRREYGARAEARRGPNADRRSSHAAIVHLYG